MVEQRKVALTFIITLSIIGFLALIFLWPYVDRKSQKKIAEVDMEEYVSSMVTTNEVSPGYEPVIIYYQNDGDVNRYCCVGTVFINKDKELNIITAEHIFRNTIKNKSIFSIKLLRGATDPVKRYLMEIVKTGSDFNGEERDAVILKMGSQPTQFTPYSRFNDGEESQNFWGEVTIQNQRVRKVKSLISGKSFEAVGYSKVDKINGAVFILIDKKSLIGESGTGFFDDHGGLWILHGAPENSDIESLIKDEYKKLTGRMIQNGLTSLSGPFGGKYD